MAISVGNIVDALITLGGAAHYRDITEEVLRTGKPPFPADPQASVRARLQENCSDYEAYKGKQDLFESEYGSGVWSLRSVASSGSRSDGISRNQFREDLEAYEAKEGNHLLREHLYRERDQTLVRKFKAALKEPRCEACSLLLSEIYGDLARDYIEAHHREPLALSTGSPTRLEDLAAVCPNCHRIIHTNYPMSVEELAELLAQPDCFSEHLAIVREARKTWKNAVYDAIKRTVARNGNRRFSRHILINEELDQIVVEVQSKGATPQQTLSRVLQELRDENVIIFVDEPRGEYVIND